LITEDDRCKSPIKDLINFDHLRFKDRDEMEDIVSSYMKKHPFEMEKLRDQRLRHYFGDRYDTRKNSIDWDLNFSITKFVCILMSCLKTNIDATYSC
jgi:dynein assembly factor 3